MNSRVTDDHQVYEYQMPREKFRGLLIASQLPQRSRLEDPYHYDFHDAGASLWECLGWVACAAMMLGGLAEALMWGLR